MANQDVTNPGSVEVANQGDGLTTVNQTITVSPSYNAGSANPALAEGPGGRPIDVTNPGDANIASETFGIGLPKNVIVS